MNAKWNWIDYKKLKSIICHFLGILPVRIMTSTFLFYYVSPFKLWHLHQFYSRFVFCSKFRTDAHKPEPPRKNFSHSFHSSLKKKTKRFWFGNWKKWHSIKRAQWRINENEISKIYLGLWIIISSANESYQILFASFISILCHAVPDLTLTLL